jgi:hypothetical protein
VITPELLRGIHKGYLQYLDDGGDRVHVDLPKGDRRHGEKRARASRLGVCPIASAYDRLGTEPTHPHLLPHNNYALLNMFREGNMVAELWQEALTWTANASTLVEGAQHEVSFESDKVVGRADSVITTCGGKSLVEFKRTDAWKINPKWAFQCAAYMRMSGINSGFLVMQNRTGDNIYTFRHERGAAIFQHEYRDEIATVSDEELDEEIERQNRAVVELPEPEFRPGECCSEKADKAYPTDRKLGAIHVNCPYFGHCWHCSGDVYTTSFKEDGVLVFGQGESVL